MSSVAGPALAHRSVANIRSAPSQGQAGSGTAPHTPPRVIASSYGSPSTIRADDDFLIIQLGVRSIRAGFAGDNLPKAVLTHGPADQRRVGDFRDWLRPGVADLDSWAEDHEIWQYNLRDVDLGLVHDKLDRLLRDAFTRCLLIDSRPRRAGIVFDSAVPIPLLSTVLDLMFQGFQTPIISLMSSATMSAVAAGVRSALVVDMGWTETVVTSVYEYREVKYTRSVRGGKFLHNRFYQTLRKILTGENEDKGKRVVSFSECEDVMCRLMWCRPSAFKSSQRQSAQLDTVEEQDESEPEQARPKTIASVPLRSTAPPRTIQVPFDKVADVCDDTFFDQSIAPTTFDDHELPVHLLVYQHLVQLPMDVRAVCMSRIIFTGGCSNILGIKERIVDEVTGMVNKKGWANVSGKHVQDARNSHFFDRRPANTAKPASSTTAATASDAGEEQDYFRPSSTASQPETDLIEAKVARTRPRTQQLQGTFRTLHSLGPWAGASLLCHLKVPAMATIDRELWLQQGANGASRPSEVDIKAQQRQSMGAGGLIRGSGGHHTNWTLGTWGQL